MLKKYSKHVLWAFEIILPTVFLSFDDEFAASIVLALGRRNNFENCSTPIPASGGSK